MLWLQSPLDAKHGDTWGLPLGWRQLDATCVCTGTHPEQILRPTHNLSPSALLMELLPPLSPYPVPNPRPDNSKVLGRGGHSLSNSPVNLVACHLSTSLSVQDADDTNDSILCTCAPSEQINLVVGGRTLHCSGSPKCRGANITDTEKLCGDQKHDADKNQSCKTTRHCAYRILPCKTMYVLHAT